MEKGVTTHSSILAWRIPWTEESGGYSPCGRKESDTIERLTDTHTHRLGLGWGEDLGYQWIKGQREAKKTGDQAPVEKVGALGGIHRFLWGESHPGPSGQQGMKPQELGVSCFQKQQQTLNSEAEYE